MEKDKNKSDINIPEVLEVLPVDEIVVFPQVILPFHLTNSEYIDMVDRVLSSPDRMLIASTRKIGTKKQKGKEGLDSIYKVGTAAVILKMLKLPDNSVQVLLQGIKRVEIIKEVEEEEKDNNKILKVKHKVLEEKEVDKENIEIEALINNLKQQVEKLPELGRNIPKEFLNYIYNVEKPSHIADLLCTVLEINTVERQELLEELDVRKRLNKVSQFLNKEIQVLSLSQKIQNKVSEKLKKSEKDFILREQLKEIHN
ncbi:MAG: LON peptidase substrate-binding domain-containing protein [Candidatus Muiribacteriota bacterium]